MLAPFNALQKKRSKFEYKRVDCDGHGHSHVCLRWTTYSASKPFSASAEHKIDIFSLRLLPPMPRRLQLKTIVMGMGMVMALKALLDLHDKTESSQEVIVR